MARKGLGKGLDALIPPHDVLAPERMPVPGSLAHIGKLLRSKREEMGLSLSDVQSATKIRKRYLEDIESGRDSDSPGDVYFRGFLKIYANYLGLDGAGLVERYRTAKEEAAMQADGVEKRPAAGAVATPEPPREAEPCWQAEPVPAAEPVSKTEPVSAPEPAGEAEPIMAPEPVIVGEPAEPEQAWLPVPGLEPAEGEGKDLGAAGVPRSPEARRPRRRHTSNQIVFVLLIAVAVSAVALIYSAAKPSTPAEAPQQPVAPVTPVVPEPTPEPQQPVQEPPTQPPVVEPALPEVTKEEKSQYLTAISVAARELHVDVEISGGPCWVRVDADGQIVTEGMLVDGTTRSWTASRRLTIRAGAPWTMSLKVNGVDLGTAGPQGSLAKDLEITAME